MVAVGTFQFGGSRSRMEKKGLRSMIVLRERADSENIRKNRFHVSLVERVEDEEMEGGKKLNRRSHQQQVATCSALHSHSGEKSHLPAFKVSAAAPCVRSLPVVQRRRRSMVSWWDGYTPYTSDTSESTCCLHLSKADHSQGRAAETNISSSTSTVRAGSHLAKVLAAQVATCPGGPSPYLPSRLPCYVFFLCMLT